MSKIQAAAPLGLCGPAAEAARAVYRDENGDLRQNPVHVAAVAERMAFEGSLGGSPTMNPLGPATLNLMAAGMRASQDVRRLTDGGRAPAVAALVLGADLRPGTQEDIGQVGRPEMRLLLPGEGAPALPLSATWCSEIATAAVGTMQGRRELMPAIIAAVRGRLRRAGFDVLPREWEPKRTVRVAASWSYCLSLHTPGCLNPRYAAAEASVASLATHLIGQLRESSPEGPLFLEMHPVEEYGEREFGWAARVVSHAPAELPAAASAPEADAGAGVARPRSQVPRFRVFVITGPHEVSLRVAGNPPLRHRASQRTIWSGLLTDAEVEHLREDLSHAEVQEIAFPRVERTKRRRRRWPRPSGRGPRDH